MYLSATDISSQAKIDIQGSRASAILAVVVPLILAAIVNFILTFIFTNEIIITITSFLTSTIAAYMTMKMVLELIKGSYNAAFNESLKPFHILAMFIGISVLFFGLHQLISLILGQFFINTGNLSSLLDVNSLSSEEMIRLLQRAIPFILLSLIITTIIETKFFSAKYLVVEGAGIIDALKTSWEYSKGYFFGIIKVHLLFLAYMLIAIVILFIGMFIVSSMPFFAILLLLAFLVWTFGFFLPHYTYALAGLHLFLRKSNGNPYVHPSKTNLNTQVNSTDSQPSIFDDTSKEVKEDKFDSWDF